MKNALAILYTTRQDVGLVYKVVDICMSRSKSESAEIRIRLEDPRWRFHPSTSIITGRQ
jgi:hypothetical protein